MSNVMRLSDIEAKPVSRAKTWFPKLDLVYGVNDLPVHNIGMPIGKISLWAGQAGVGKSRLCIEVAKNFSTNYNGGKVLYFLTESEMSDFGSWAKDTAQYNDIYCSGENKIDEMIKIIYEVKPNLVFIDSANEIDEFENGNKKETRRLINGVDGRPGLKQAANETKAHIILLGQLNQDGKTIKGGTSLPHLVDIALKIVKTDELGVFKVEVGGKHRYGSTENVALFRHTDDGVEEYVPYVAPVVQAPVQRRVYTPSMYHMNKYVGKIQYRQEQQPDGSFAPFWTVENEKYITDVMNKRAKEGSIKLDKNGVIIPKKDRVGLLSRLNSGVGKMFGLE